MDDGVLLVTCPHCKHQVLVARHDINCGIFRHAVLKTTGIQINPHSSESECNAFLEHGLVHGCAKPFQVSLDPTTDEPIVTKCGYI